MSNNPLLNLLGYQWVRCNGGPRIAVRSALRLRGMVATDEPARRRTSCARVDNVRVRFNATVDTAGGYWVNTEAEWFGMTTDFDQADDVYVTVADDSDETVLAGFMPPSGDPGSTYRKQIVNAGTLPFSIFNFRRAGDYPDFDDPGMVVGVLRTLREGEACRLVFDPVSHLWLVNNGLYSAEYLTHDSELLTHDGETLTHDAD